MARAKDSQPSLFATAPSAPEAVPADAPLAERMRPRTLAEFVGQAHLVGDHRLLRDMIEGQRLHSLILWGPPGTGKTSLARLIARSTDAHFISFSAVLSGVKELRVVVEEARDIRRHQGRRAILFVDEIHRFNKAQQDAFLPHVEDGTIVLIGATTENPSFEIIAPLLSRASVLVLQPLHADDLRTIIERACTDPERGLGGRIAVEPAAVEALVNLAHGDARAALNILDTAADMASLRTRSSLAVADVEEAAQRRALRYDKAGDEHYNIASAFIKSMRGSDPDAAVYWMLRMLEAGDDPLFVARRMVIFAAEDVGLADPQALAMAVAAKDAVEFVGLPEGKIPLAEAAVYLATAPKSNSTYAAMLAAAEDVRTQGPLPVPLHLRNAPTRLMRELGYGKGYQYAHAQPDQAVSHEHLPDELSGRRYYEPADNPVERAVSERLETIRRRRG
jgi:putative ATPase